jgi:hypothetical protein
VKAYKFSKSIFVPNIENGKVFISPAHEMRVADSHSDGRTDPNELIKTTNILNEEEIVRSDHPAFPPDIFITIRGGVREHMDFVMGGGQFSIIENALIYCLSTEFNNDICNMMLEKFDYDAAFEISDVEKFGQVISQHPNLLSRRFLQGQVDYQNIVFSDSINAMTPVDPFVKETKFNWQAEYRFVWEGEVTGPAFEIEVPETKSLLKRIL